MRRSFCTHYPFMMTACRYKCTHVMIEQKSRGKDLRQAHRHNDRLVMQAYGFAAKMTESECVAELFRRYGEMVG